MPEDVNGSIAGKMITRILYFDYITTAITPLPKQWLIKRENNNYELIYHWNKNRCQYYKYRFENKSMRDLQTRIMACL